MEKPKTRDAIVLDYLQTHIGMTSMDAFDLGITRLSAAIFNLRQEGYSILNVQREETNRYGKKVRFVEYRLKG